MKSDYLKYYKIYRKYLIRKYKFKEPYVFDALIFLYSEGVFSYKTMDMWKRVGLFRPSDLWYFIDEGYIDIVKKRSETAKAFEADRSLYQISRKGKRVVEYFYELLEGKRLISSSDLVSKAKRVPKSFIEMREYIFRIKQETLRLEQEQRQPPEE